MYIFYNGTDIPSRPGERLLAQAAYDHAQFALVRQTLTPGYGVVYLDQSTLDNQTLAVDIFNTLSVDDFRGLRKYYVVAATGRLWQRGNWRPAIQGEYAPTQDVLINTGRSAELTEFEDSFTDDIARLDQIIGGNVLPAVAVRDLARHLKRTNRLIRRLLRVQEP